MYVHFLSRSIENQSVITALSVPAIFGALSIHTFDICRKDRVGKQLAENKSRQCLLALGELAKSWPVSIWIANAFVDLMQRLTGEISSKGSIVNVSSRIAKKSNDMALCEFVSPDEIPSTTSPEGTVYENDLAMNPNGYSQGSNTDVHTFDHISQTAEPPFSDSLWPSHLEDVFDIDSFLHSSLGPTLSSSFEK